MTEPSPKFSEVLFRLRRKIGWSREKLARAVGLSAKSIDRYEGAETEPSEEVRLTILNRLHRELRKEDVLDAATLRELKAAGFVHMDLSSDNKSAVPEMIKGARNQRVEFAIEIAKHAEATDEELSVYWQLPLVELKRIKAGKVPTEAQLARMEHGSSRAFSDLFVFTAFKVIAPAKFEFLHKIKEANEIVSDLLEECIHAKPEASVWFALRAQIVSKRLDLALAIIPPIDESALT